MLDPQKNNEQNFLFKNFDWPSFFKKGAFLGSPALNKIWCVYGEDTLHSKIEANVSDTDGSLAACQTKKEVYFYRNDFDRTLKNPWILSAQGFEFDLDDFFDHIKDMSSVEPAVIWSVDANLKNKNDYLSMFAQIKNAIHQSLIQKAVPFYREEGALTLTEQNLIHFLKCLSPLRHNNELYFYGIWNFLTNPPTLCCGASPELLFLKSNQKLHTIALAGTSLSPKDFSVVKMENEHDCVVQDLCEELKTYGDVVVASRSVVPFHNFFHQKTQISVDCSNLNLSFTDILQSVYPSAAIGAYPRAKGLEFLRKLEEEHGQKRGFFAAPLGIRVSSCRDNDFQLCVGTIRGIECSEGKIFITAGGGVVAQSVVNDEWKEIELKIKSIKSIYQLV